MGSSSSKNTLEIVNDTINQNLTNILVNVQNSNSALCSSNQSMNLEFGEKANFLCGIDISQGTSVNCNLSSMFKTTSNADLTTLTNQAIDSSANSSNSTTQNFLSASVSDSNNNTTMKNYIKNLVEKNVNSTTTNTCIAQASADQSLNLKINSKVGCKPDGTSLNLSQNAQVAVLSSCITDNLFGVIANDAVVQKAVSEGSVSNTTVQKGVSDLIAEFFKGLNSGFLIIAFVVVACIIAGAYILLSPAGQSALNKASDAAVKRI